MELIAERLYTVDEYFAFCEEHEGLYEFVNGKINKTAGKNTDSNKIAGNIHRYLGRLLEDSNPYSFFQNGAGLLVETERVYRVPDFMITHEAGDQPHFVTEPILIVEVLSESTQDVDRRIKLVEYCRLASLHYYLIVSPDLHLVEVYRRQDTQWVFEYYTQISETIPLPFLPAELPLAVIYRRVGV